MNEKEKRTQRLERQAELLRAFAEHLSRKDLEGFALKYFEAPRREPAETFDEYRARLAKWVCVRCNELD